MEGRPHFSMCRRELRELKTSSGKQVKPRPSRLQLPAETTTAQTCGANSNGISSAILAISGLSRAFFNTRNMDIRLCLTLSHFILCEQWLSGRALPWVTPFSKKHLDHLECTCGSEWFVVYTDTTCLAPPQRYRLIND